MLHRLDAAGNAVTWLGSPSGAERLALLRHARALRERALERWSSLRMATEYAQLYESLLRARRPRALAAPAASPRTTLRMNHRDPFSPLWKQ